jgi:hypothetical protein
VKLWGGDFRERGLAKSTGLNLEYQYQVTVLGGSASRIAAGGSTAPSHLLPSRACSREQFRHPAAATDYLRKDRRKKPKQARNGAVTRQEPEL